MRLPLAFAEILYGVTEGGVTVVVADETTNGESVLHPGDAVPVDAITGLEPGDDGSIADSVALGISAPATPNVPVAARTNVVASLDGSEGN